MLYTRVSMEVKDEAKAESLKPTEKSQSQKRVGGKIRFLDRETQRFPGEREWTLIALDDEKFWEGVADEAEWENYLAGGPEPKHWRRTNKPPTMRPSYPVSSTRLSLEEALGRLEKVRRTGRRWKALCPAHEDHSPSLIVAESPDWSGYPVFYCYVGCTHQQVKDALMERL